MDTDRTRSLTYAEMAAVMGITLASAKNLTRRKRWPRTRSNEGHVRILVPLDYLAESEGEGRRDGPSASPREGAAGGPALHLMMSRPSSSSRSRRSEGLRSPRLCHA